MAKFTVAYFGQPDFKNEEEGRAYMDAWRRWAATVGGALVSEANPVVSTKIMEGSTVSDADNHTRFSGYSVLEAPDIDAAVAIMESCPHLQFGTLQIGRQMIM